MLLLRDFTIDKVKAQNNSFDEYQTEYRNLVYRNNVLKDKEYLLSLAGNIDEIKKWKDDPEIIDRVRYESLNINPFADYLLLVLDTNDLCWKTYKGDLTCFKTKPNHIKLYLAKKYWYMIDRVQKHLSEIYPTLLYRETRNMSIHFIHQNDKFNDLNFLNFEDSKFKEELDRFKSNMKIFDAEKMKLSFKCYF